LKMISLFKRLDFYHFFSYDSIDTFQRI
jgi:hypothetical protein